MGAQVLTLSMAFTDNVLVGRLGVEPLASLAMATGFYAIVMLTVMGLLSALSPLIAEAEGGGRRSEIGVLVGQGLRLAALTSVVAVLLFACASEILLLFGQNPALVPDAQRYLSALAWGVPAQCGYVALRQFTEGVGNSRPSVILAAIAAALNVPLAYALIHGVGGLPRLGVAGAGYATALLLWGMFAGLGMHVTRNRRYADFALVSGFKTRAWPTLRRVLTLGIPLAGALASEVAFFASSTLLAGTIGTVQQAAHQVALNAASFTFMIPFGLSVAVSVRIGQAVGRQDVRALRAAASVGVGLTLAFQALAALAFLVAPHAVAGVYSDDVALVAVATA
jgi:MATE family multidrug resistance protein